VSPPALPRAPEGGSLLLGASGAWARGMRPGPTRAVLGLACALLLHAKLAKVRRALGMIPRREQRFMTQERSG
jgi:hypothetical protein